MVCNAAVTARGRGYSHRIEMMEGGRATSSHKDSNDDNPTKGFFVVQAKMTQKRVDAPGPVQRHVQYNHFGVGVPGAAVSK